MTDVQQAWSRQTPQNLALFARGCASFRETDFYMDEREDLEGPLCNVTVVFKEHGDVVFQLFPKTRKWPRGEAEGRGLLADLLDVYFGDLGRFAGSHVPELGSWAVRARGLAELPSYVKEHHVYGFAAYVNAALDEL